MKVARAATRNAWWKRNHADGVIHWLAPVRLAVAQILVAPVAEVKAIRVCGEIKSVSIGEFIACMLDDRKAVNVRIPSKGAVMGSAL